MMPAKNRKALTVSDLAFVQGQGLAGMSRWPDFFAGGVQAKAGQRA